MDAFPGLVHWVSDFNADGELNTFWDPAHLYSYPPTFFLKFALMPEPEEEEYEAWKQ